MGLTSTLIRCGPPREAGHSLVYGDTEDPEFASTLPLASARWVDSSVLQLRVNLALSQALSRQGYAGRIAVTARNDADAIRLQEVGSDLIRVPFVGTAKKVVEALCHDKKLLYPIVE